MNVTGHYGEAKWARYFYVATQMSHCISEFGTVDDCARLTSIWARWSRFTGYPGGPQYSPANEVRAFTAIRRIYRNAGVERRRRLKLPIPYPDHGPLIPPQS